MKWLKHIWKRLQGAGYWTQISLIAGAYGLFYVALFILINQFTWSYTHGPDWAERVTQVTTFLFLDSSEASGISSMWSGINKLGLLLLTAFSSSVLTSKMISHQSKLRFSKPLAYYSRAIIESEQSQFQGEYLVLRLLNENEHDLFNVRISATLRYYHVPTRTFQHYTCKVTNGNIPVLGSMMPFRIYIEMSEIVSAIYRKTLCFATSDQSDVIAIAAIQNEIKAGTRPAHADRLILYVEGIDSGEGKLTTAAHQYPLDQVGEGQFRSIEPAQDGSGFDAKSINQHFDQVSLT
ncbi:hypothetical protein [Aquabacterium sp.]|uniref:hypothetical protein n=1 Tax=Aquabacterium sp. TaxID=1872578 RepID=UPI0035AF7F18